MTPEQVEAALALLRAKAHVVPLTVSVAGVATHLEDDLVLATVLSGAAGYLGTRDKQLLKLDGFRKVRIVHPADLINLLQPTGGAHP